jgi:excisionase family DNA binding protein
MNEEQKLLLRPVEVAERIGVARSRAYELIHAGVIPSIRIGASIRVPVAALKAWIDQQLEAASAERTQR